MTKLKAAKMILDLSLRTIQFKKKYTDRANSTTVPDSLLSAQQIAKKMLRSGIRIAYSVRAKKKARTLSPIEMNEIISNSGRWLAATASRGKKQFRPLIFSSDFKALAYPHTITKNKPKLST